MRLPVVTHCSGDSVVAWRRGTPITRDRLLMHAAQVSSALPPGTYVINACTDRYHFCVAFLAALMSGRTSLFPPAYTAEAMRQVAAQVEDAVILADADSIEVEGVARMPMPHLSFDTTVEQLAVPLLPGERQVAWVFTSGSTGIPVPHLKTWAKLVANTRGAAARMAAIGQLSEGFCVLGTVPAQHMYGFESIILLALQNGGSIACDKVFFPAEVASTLAGLPSPRILVSTPFHLRNMLQSDTEAVSADLLLSATAPLDTDTARLAEQRFHAPLVEIYGSTETGQIATRRTVEGDRWQLLANIALRQHDGLYWASGGHIEQEVPLGDQVELIDGKQFRLLGRNSDMVNIAGKRSSLAYLERLLLSIAGVHDGAFHLPDEDAQGRVRLAAFVVAPGLSRQEILEALRRQVDPVFLPRPLIMLDKLPRTATGKLPRSVRVGLLAAAAQTQGGGAEAMDNE